MATKKDTKSEIKQSAILGQEQKTTTESASEKKIVKSRKRVSLEEFAIVNNLRPEVVAGFKAWLKGDLFHFDEEWDNLFCQYKNRTL